MPDLFDTLTEQSESPDSGDIFDQLSGGVREAPSSPSPASPGQTPFQPASAPAQPPAQETPEQRLAKLPESMQFQQGLADMGEKMQRQQPDTTILGAIGAVASIPFKALGAVGADILNRGRAELQASGEGDPRIYAPRFGESEEARKERLTFRTDKPLYTPQGTAIDPSGSDLQRLISQWSSPESLAMLAAAKIPLGRLAMGVQMTAGAPQQVHRILSGDLTDEQKRDEINNLFAMGLLIAKGGAYPHAVHAGAEPGRPGYLRRTIGENVASLLGNKPDVSVTPEIRASRKQAIAARAPDFGITDPSFVEGRISPEHPNDVAQSLGGGKVVISEKNLHHRLEQELGRGVTIEEAIDNVLSEESIHDKFRNLQADKETGQPSGDEMALGLWDSMSGIERNLFRRKLHGPNWKNRGLTDLQFGHEALRFAFQRLKNIRPGEHIFGTAKEIGTSKIMTVLEDAIRWIRRNIGRTAASAKQLEYLDLLKQQADTLKKGKKDAIQERGAEEVPVGQPSEAGSKVGAQVRVGEEPAPAQEAVAQEAQVPLKPNDKLPGVDRDEEGYAGDEQPKVQAALDSLPVGSLVQHRFTEDVYEKKANGEWHHRPDLQILGNGNADAGKGSANGLAKAKVLRVGAGKAEAPPVVAQGAPAGQAPPGKAKAPVAAGEPAAAPSISPPSAPVKSAELEALQQDLLKGGFSMEKYSKFKELSAKQLAANQASGVGPKRQSGEPLAMSRKAKYADSEGKERELEVQPGEWIVKVQRPDGSTYDASYKGQSYELPPEMAKIYGTSKLASVGRPTEKGWSHGMLKKGEKIVEGEQGPPEPLAMSLKSREVTEEDVARKLVATVKDDVSKEEKSALVQQVFDHITSLPREKWGDALDDFQAKWEAATVDESNRDIEIAVGGPSEPNWNNVAEALMREAKMPEEEIQAKLPGFAAKLKKDYELRPENIKAVFGDADRKVLSRRVIFSLNKPPAPINPRAKKENVPETKVRPGTVLGGSPARKAEKPRYRYDGQWETFWKALQEEHPEIPEHAARDAYTEGVQNFLSNASGAKIRELLRPARLERKFLGESLLRHIPDPDPNPILADMAAAPSPEKSLAFKKFCDARGLTVEQGLAEIEKLKAQQVQEMRERADIGKARPGREELPEGDVKAQFEEWRKAKALDRKRREKAVSALSNWLVKQATPPGRNPMRRELDFDDIWFDSKERIGAYAEYDSEQGGDYGFLQSTLGKASSMKGKVGSKLSRGLVVLVDNFNGETHAVSVYRHPTSQEPLIYDPSGIVGSKTKNHRPLGELLNQYRVKSYALVRDPLHRFHQKWKTEEAFDKEIGNDAKSWENDANKQWVAFQTGVEPADVPVEEEMSPIERERIARKLEESGGRPWEGTAEMGEGTTAEQKAQDRAAFEAWSQSPAWGKGPGQGEWGMFPTDPKRLVRGDLTSVEADSIYELIKEFKMKGPEDFDRMFKVLSGFRKIVERAKPSGRTKPKRGVEGFYLRGRDYCAVSGIDKIARKKYLEWARSKEAQELFAQYPRLPKHGDYDAMTADEKQRYKLEQTRRYIALGEALEEVYAIADQTRLEHATPGGEAVPEGPLAAPEDTVAFRSRALDRYGDTARRDVEQAAVQKEPATGRQLTTPGRSKPIPVQGGVTAGKRFLPPDPVSPGMLPEGAKPYEATPPSKGAFPDIPVTPSNIGGKKFKGQLPAKTPEIAHPVELGEEKGFTPQQPGYDKAAYEQWQARQHQRGLQGQDPLAMTLKGVGVADRYREEMKLQGRSQYQKEEEAPESKAEGIAKGMDLIKSGHINPELEMLQFEHAPKDEGYLSINSTRAFRAWDYRLQGVADAAAQKYGIKSKQSQELMQVADEWKARMDKASKKMFARTGHALQGLNQLGPDDMKSTTFVRNALKKAKAKQKGVEEDDYELTDEDEELVSNLTARVRKGEVSRSEVEMAVGEEYTKAQDVPLDPGPAAMVSRVKSEMKKVRGSAASILKKGTPKESAMAMKGGELPPIKGEELDALANIGMDVMTDLSDKGLLTDDAWTAEMKKVLASDEVGRPDLEPYLDKVRAASEEIRNDFLNSYIGTGKAVSTAKERLTRKAPTVEESKAAIQRALEADPTGRHITPAEAFHVWNYLRQRFFDPNSPEHTLDFREIRTKGSAELGIKDDLLGVSKPYTQLRLFRAMSSNRTMRKLSEELVKKMRDEARIKGQAMNWLRNQQYPGWLRGIRLFPRLFFFDKILGHGLVPMITHAPSMIFNPKAWSVYFGSPGKRGAWAEMYKMTGWPTGKGQAAAELYHQLRMEELTGHERFEFWKSARLECDPFKYTDDYQIEALQTVFGKHFEFLTKGRGFDALKTLRFAMAEKWLNSLPEHLRNKESASLIADSVNHATGIVKTQFHESLNWMMFAPKLEASRWAFLFKDTAKAIDVIRKGKDASLEQRAWAKSELKQKAMMVGMYYGMLALNQAFLGMTGSKQKVNMTDPTKPDFMSFKVAGFKIGLASPLIGVFKMMAHALHAAVGDRTKFEKLTSRQKQLGEIAWQYGRGKMSPLASFATDITTQEDPMRRPLPWSNEPLSRARRLRGERPYSKGEYFAETFSPIPLQEALKETWKSQGMSESDASHLLRALTIAGSMAATGARVTEDEP